MQSTKNNIGVILLNLGGPENERDVEPFLYNLFSDRGIIRLGPAFLQKPIARFIARRRAPKSRDNYRQIGGGSPIGRITTEQAGELEKSLADDGRFIVRSAMRYWHPSATETLEKLVGKDISALVALPLYPHYSKATTGSSFDDLQKCAQKLNIQQPIIPIKSWPKQPDYIQALASRIQTVLDKFQQKDVQIIYSAHSLPQKFIEEGDPYVKEIEETIRAVEKQTGQKGRLCFQSRSGPVRWLDPSTPEMLQQLAAEGCKNILMVPISFVSDHVETLYEVDILYREMARDLGMRLLSTPGLNTDPCFISALRNLVLAAISQR